MLKRLFSKADKKTVIFGIVAFFAFALLIYLFPYSGDDWAWGSQIGLDRLAMLMTGCDSLRDVTAFPKVQNASELMSQAPGTIDDKQLEELSISIVKKENK